jgi:hypothetical protein
VAPVLGGVQGGVTSDVNYLATLGIAATAAKALPLYGALRGHNLHALITDEAAVEGVIKLFEHDFRGEATVRLPQS